MTTSSSTKVCEMYEQSAKSYAEMMDSEIDLPVYADTLGRLAERIVDIPGSVVDTSCGPGHMLLRYHEHFDPERSVIGVDLSPRMVAIARSHLGATAKVMTGDMRNLAAVEGGSAAAVLSFFAIHHIGPEDVVMALQDWHRVLGPGGKLVIAAWEGTGPIDYGGAFDLVALRYSQEEIAHWVQESGFVVNRYVVEPVEEMPMEAVYLEATKQTTR